MSERRHPSERRLQLDRREASRINACTGIRFLRAGSVADNAVQAELLDVSHSGVRIALQQPLIRGENLLIEIRDTDGKCFNLSAQVVWVDNLLDTEHRVGCELRVALTRKQFCMLRNMVEELHAELV